MTFFFVLIRVWHPRNDHLSFDGNDIVLFYYLECALKVLKDTPTANNGHPK